MAPWRSSNLVSLLLIWQATCNGRVDGWNQYGEKGGGYGAGEGSGGAYPWAGGSWQAEYAALHRSILNGTAPAASRRYLVWTCGTTFRSPDCHLRTQACNCVGYANRMLGLASAFLAAIITSRALLIAWPGEEGTQLDLFFHSSLVDWRVTDDVMHELGLPASFERLQQDWARQDLLHVINGEYGQVVLVSAEKAEFRDVFMLGYHEEELAGLGLRHADEVMSLLALLLQPTGALLAAIDSIHAASSLCHIVGIQVRIAAEARSNLQVTICVLMLLYMSPHTTIYVSSYYCIRFLILEYMCAHTTEEAKINMCAHSTEAAGDVHVAQILGGSYGGAAARHHAHHCRSAAVCAGIYMDI